MTMFGIHLVKDNHMPMVCAPSAPTKPALSMQMLHLNFVKQHHVLVGRMLFEKS